MTCRNTEPGMTAFAKATTISWFLAAKSIPPASLLLEICTRSVDKKNISGLMVGTLTPRWKQDETFLPSLDSTQACKNQIEFPLLFEKGKACPSWSSHFSVRIIDSQHPSPVNQRAKQKWVTRLSADWINLISTQCLFFNWYEKHRPCFFSTPNNCLTASSRKLWPPILPPNIQ